MGLQEANLYLEGEDLEVLSELQSFLATLRFAYGSERLVEGGHARVNMINLPRRHRTEVSDSLALRMPEIESVLTSSNVTDFLECLHSTRNPRTLVHRLGLLQHPGVADAAVGNNWDPAYRSVLYHGDAVSMYSRDGRPVLLQRAPEAARDRGSHVFMPCDSVLELRDLWRQAALNHVKSELAHTYLHAQSRWIFSCKLPDRALRALVELMAPASTASVSANYLDASNLPNTSSLLEEARLGPSVFFQVVSAHPSRAHIAGGSALESSDLGVVLFKCHGFTDETASRQVRVETSPIQTGQLLAEAWQMVQQPLILSLSTLDLQQLESFVAWPEGMLEAPEGEDRVQQLLSKDGSKRILHARPLPRAEQSHWELMQHLEKQGWRCIVARDKVARICTVYLGYSLICQPALTKTL